VVVSAGTLSAPTLVLDQTDAYLGVNAGTVTITDAVTIDGPQAGAGEILVSGGQLSLEGGLTLDGGAALGVGSFVVASAGGVVTTPELTVGETGAGYVSVLGSNAHLNVSGALILGESGSGSLTVENGGHVTIGGNAESAVMSGSTATGRISDAAADLTFDKDWEIGVAGTATWTLGSGASATVAGKTELGVSSGGSGTLTLTDADTMVVGGGSVIVGAVGSGTLNVQSGAEFNGAAGTLTVAEARRATARWIWKAPAPSWWSVAPSSLATWARARSCSPAARRPCPAR
jgi:T5SS/PEP-CTERM-associated repeat protein